jgi:hypothetical protein
MDGPLAFDRRGLDDAALHIRMLTAAVRWESAQALELARQVLDVKHRAAR